MSMCEHNKLKQIDRLEDFDGVSIECARIVCAECGEDMTQEYYNL